MKLALVLASDIRKRDWICYVIAESVTEIENLNCYDSTFIKLPKSQYAGEIGSLIIKQSCATGSTSEFRIVTISNLKINGTFNLM